MSQLLRESASAGTDSAALASPASSVQVLDRSPAREPLKDLAIPDAPVEDARATRHSPRRLADEPDRKPQSSEHPGAFFRHEYEDIAIRLAVLDSLQERISFYRETGIPKLSRAAALRPDLVPRLNDEFEWITLSSADLR